MKWLTNIFKQAKQKSVNFFRLSTTTGREHIFDIINLEAYHTSLYLFIGVSMIRETISSIPLELYRIKNNDGDVEEVINDPFRDLLTRPNERQTQKEFWKLSISYYLLAGEAFWYLERPTPNAAPTAKVNMRPDHVEVLISEETGEVRGYQFQKLNGERLFIQPENVLHFKNVDPTNPIRGIGVVRPATQRIITEREASKHQAETFRNQGRPDIAVFTNVDSLTEEAAAEARINWQKVYGRDQGSQAGFFGAEVRDLKLLNSSPKEMDFIESQNFLRDDILAALHVPKAMVTSDDVNLANSRTARINYLKEAVMPVLDAFLDVINNKYLVDEKEDMFITYESPVQEDREMLLKEAVELKQAGIIKINEARALMNFEFLDEGDILEGRSAPSIQLAIRNEKLRKEALQHIKKRTLLYKKNHATAAVTKLLEEKNVTRYRNPVFNTNELKNAYLRAYNENVDRKALSFLDHIIVYNEGLLKRIMKQMEDFGVNVDNIFNVNDEIRTAKEVFIPLMKEMYSRVGQETLDNIANGFAVTERASEHFYTLMEMERQLELRAEFFITSMLNTDWKQMKEIILEGLEQGMSVAEIGRALRKYFDDMSVSRGKMIARTETGRLVSQATQDAYEQSEFVTGKEWLTVGDADVRHEHSANEAQGAIGKYERFQNGESYPGEASINCRCALAPTV